MVYCYCLSKSTATLDTHTFTSVGRERAARVNTCKAPLSLLLPSSMEYTVTPGVEIPHECPCRHHGRIVHCTLQSSRRGPGPMDGGQDHRRSREWYRLIELVCCFEFTYSYSVHSTGMNCANDV
jgi:hypothetical protein